MRVPAESYLRAGMPHSLRSDFEWCFHAVKDGCGRMTESVKPSPLNFQPFEEWVKMMGEQIIGLPGLPLSVGE